ALVAIFSCKAEVADTAVTLTNEAMTLCGGIAYGENAQLARLLRDPRAAHVMSPTTDMPPLGAGRALLGLPPLGGGGVGPPAPPVRDPPGRAAAVARLLTDAAGGEAFRVELCDPDEGPARLREALAEGREPGAALIGPHNPRPLQLARHVRRVAPL